MEWLEIGWLSVEFEWNGGWLGREILIFGRELGLDILNSGVRMGKGLEKREIDTGLCQLYHLVERGVLSHQERETLSWTDQADVELPLWLW